MPWIRMRGRCTEVKVDEIVCVGAERKFGILAKVWLKERIEWRMLYQFLGSGL